MLPRLQTRVSRPVHQPPATSTRPLGRSVAVSLARAVCIEPVAVHVPVAGSYSSALATGRPVTSPPTIPPATSTLPSWSSVAAAPVTAKGMCPVAENVRVAGLYSSAVAVPRRPPAPSRWAAGWPSGRNGRTASSPSVPRCSAARARALPPRWPWEQSSAGPGPRRQLPRRRPRSSAGGRPGVAISRFASSWAPQPVTVNVAFAPAKLRWPRAAIWWAPAVAWGTVIVVVNVPVLVVVGRARISPLSQNSATRSPA